MPSSAELDGEQLRWVEKAQKAGVAVVVLEADTGMGKTWVAQRLYDRVAAANSGGYWREGMTPHWPQDRPSRVESHRKTVNPIDLRNPNAKKLGFVWVGLPLGEIDHAGRFESHTQIFEQLVVTHRDCLRIHASKARRGNLFKAFRHTVWTATKTVLGFVGLGGLMDAVGGVEDSTSVISSWRDAFADPESKEYERARAAVLEKLTQIRDLALEENEPVIIVLDDAHAASPEIIELMSLITNVALEEPAQKWKAPGHNVPVLVVATTWPGESQARNGLFEQWLKSAKKQLPRHSVEQIEIESLDKQTTERLLAGTKLPGHWQTRVYDKISALRRGAGVNALVLANAVAFLEDQLASGANPQDIDTLIEKIQTTPEFHLKQRLERLRDEQGGEEAFRVITKAVHWGVRAPVALIGKFTENPHEVLSLLREKKLVALGDTLSPYETFSFQIDMYGYISRQYQDHSAVVAFAPEIREGLTEHVLSIGNTTAARRTDFSQIFVRSINLAPIGTLYAIRDTQPDAFSAETIPASDAMAFLYAEKAGAFALRKNEQLFENYWRVLTNLAGGDATEGQIAVISRMDSIFQREFTPKQRSKHRKELVDILRKTAPSNPAVAMKFIRLVGPQNEQARNFLAVHAADHPDVANRLATIYEKENVKKSIELLQPHVTTHPSSAIRIAQWDPSQAEKLLKDLAKTNPQAAIELAKTTPKQKAVKLLKGHATTNAEAAIALSRILSWREAEKVLSQQLNNKAVANAYTELLLRKAKSALRPHQGTDPELTGKLFLITFGEESRQHVENYAKDKNVSAPAMRNLQAMYKDNPFQPPPPKQPATRNRASTPKRQQAAGGTKPAKRTSTTLRQKKRRTPPPTKNTVSEQNPKGDEQPKDQN